MQGTTKKTGKLPKKPKIVVDEAAAADLNSDRRSNHGTFFISPVSVLFTVFLD